MSSGSAPSPLRHGLDDPRRYFDFDDDEPLPLGRRGVGPFLVDDCLPRRTKTPASLCRQYRRLTKLVCRYLPPSPFPTALNFNSRTAPASSTEVVILGPAAEGNPLKRRHPASAVSVGAATACRTSPTASMMAPVAYPPDPWPTGLGDTSASGSGGLIFGSASNPTVLKTSVGGGRVFLSGAAPKAAAPKATALRTYGRDMTAEAGKTDPVIGLDDEIDRVVCVLCRRTKNSAVLVGAPGVGKTAIAEGLAQRIAKGTVPAALSGARVVEVDLGAMVAGNKYLEMFEDRIKEVIQEAEDAAGKVILFIDEMHMLLGAGWCKGGSMDGANLLKPALARGHIRCVGATTFDEYRTYVEKDAAFERRFQKVHVEEPSTQATIAILQGLKQRYEEHHGLKIQDAALVAAAQLAGRYINGRQFPDKAIDLIDEACANTRMQIDNHREVNVTTMQIDSQEEVNTVQNISANAVKEAIVGPDHVAQVVSRWTGIPVTTLSQEKEKLIHQADRLLERVVGQDEAVNLVAQAGLDKSGQPIGSFLFLGSTGVRKTSLQKLLLSNYLTARRC